LELDTFWRFIARARSDAGDDAAEIAGRVMELLVQESIDTIVDFDRALYRVLARAHTRGLWAAYAIINYGASDSGFEHFKAWLVAQGESVFDTALEDPDSLVTTMDVDGTAECEEMLYVAQYAYERRTGREIPIPQRRYALNDVALFSEDQLPGVCPRLWAKFSN
jgi:Protein of unknown function (DUF4240)